LETSPASDPISITIDHPGKKGRRPHDEPQPGEEKP
jgi:hypothetical protein